MSLERIGETQAAQGDLAGALKSYRDSLAVREHLAKSDPSNEGWQRDVAMAYIKVAQVLGAVDDKVGALDALRTGREIAARLGVPY